MTKDLAYYLALPYEPVWQTRNDDGEYLLVSIKEMPAVCAWGHTELEAQDHLRQALEDYVAWRLEEHLPIPEPAVSRVPASIAAP